MYLFLDTETTGVTSEDRIVSVCWTLHDASATMIKSAHHIVRPDGFAIPTSATDIHGITTDHARRIGIPLADALESLYGDIDAYGPELYVGHNVAFDRPIVLNEYWRTRLTENLSPLPTFCTMRSGTNVCCIPRERGGYKWPTLGELHEHLLGRALSSAHDAEADVQACARCFFQLQRMGIAP